VSLLSTSAIIEASRRLSAQVTLVCDVLGTFLEEDLSPKYLGLVRDHRRQLKRFQDFLTHFYTKRFGLWPAHTIHIFPKTLLLSIYYDFEKLIDYLVDPNSTGSLNQNPAPGGLCVLQNIIAFDKRHGFATLEHPLVVFPVPPPSQLNRRLSIPRPFSRSGSKGGFSSSSRPGSSAGDQAAENERPGSTHGAPESVYEGTESIYERPESIHEQPESILEKPSSIYERPSSAYERPTSRASAKPSLNFGRPNPSLGRPRSSSGWSAFNSARPVSAAGLPGPNLKRPAYFLGRSTSVRSARPGSRLGRLQSFTLGTLGIMEFPEDAEQKGQSNSLFHAYRQYEEDLIHSGQDYAAFCDGRKVRWILIYGLTQMLKSVLHHAPKDDVSSDAAYVVYWDESTEYPWNSNMYYGPTDPEERTESPILIESQNLSPPVNPDCEMDNYMEHTQVKRRASWRSSILSREPSTLALRGLKKRAELVGLLNETAEEHKPMNGLKGADGKDVKKEKRNMFALDFKSLARVPTMIFRAKTLNKKTISRRFTVHEVPAKSSKESDLASKTYEPDPYYHKPGTVEVYSWLPPRDP
jgi:hypothetical protein